MLLEYFKTGYCDVLDFAILEKKELCRLAFFVDSEKYLYTHMAKSDVVLLLGPGPS